MESEQRIQSRSRLRDAKLVLATAALTAVGVISGTNVIKDFLDDRPDLRVHFISSNPADFRYRIETPYGDTCYSDQRPDFVGAIRDAYCPTRSEAEGKHVTGLHTGGTGGLKVTFNK